MKALITGTAGFIGSTLADRLLKDGADVVGLDCFADYYPRAYKERNIADAKRHPNFRFVEGRIQDVDIGSLLADRTHVFHLAAQAGLRKSWGCRVLPPMPTPRRLWWPTSTRPATMTCFAR